MDFHESAGRIGCPAPHARHIFLRYLSRSIPTPVSRTHQSTIKILAQKTLTSSPSSSVVAFADNFGDSTIATHTGGRRYFDPVTVEFLPSFRKVFCFIVDCLSSLKKRRSRKGTPTSISNFFENRVQPISEANFAYLKLLLRKGKALNLGQG